MRRWLSFSLIGLHIITAVFIVRAVHSYYVKRDAKAETLRQAAATERSNAKALKTHVAIQEATINGIHKRDPYLIEKLARDKLGYESNQHNELRPPPLPNE